MDINAVFVIAIYFLSYMMHSGENTTTEECHRLSLHRDVRECIGMMSHAVLAYVDSGVDLEGLGGSTDDVERAAWCDGSDGDWVRCG